MQPKIPQSQQILVRAFAAHQTGNVAQAEFLYKAVLQIDKKQFDALHMLGLIEAQRGNFSAGLKRIQDALRVRPNAPDALINLGRIQYELGKPEAAVTSYKKALALDSKSALAHSNLSILLRRQGRNEEALTHCDAALNVAPDYPDAWNNRGNVLIALRKFREALDAYERALKLTPNLAEAWLGRATALVELRRYAEAYAAYERALSLDPGLAEQYAAGHRLHSKLCISDWRDLDRDIASLLEKLRAGKTVSVPFALISLPSTPADQLLCAELNIAAAAAPNPVWTGGVYHHDRIRIAYLSSDLREHAVAYLTAGLFEHHDKSRFETTAISFETERESQVGRRIQAAFDRFIEASSQSDEQIAQFIRQQEIDIVVDLNGFTRNARLGVFARRAAPVQVNFLGYAGTMGADFYDYIVADSTVIPQEHVAFYREKVVWMPNSFLVNDDKRPIAECTPSRAELQLPEDAFVFCSFNQAYKIEPTVFDIWMRLLATVEGSVLWLKDNDRTATLNLRREAERRGVAPERLIFAPSLPDVADHLARQRHADLFLDTLYYNAHTTAADALWVGVPVLTCLGGTFAGRVAASLVRAVGLPELVTQSLADYEALALKLAREPALLAATKAKLVENRRSFPLFDTRRFTRDLEAAYTVMWQRALRGEPAENFAVPSD
jgi:predicted O-linked N-acetylglucosamine transferase (SPINDLY family)